MRNERGWSERRGLGLSAVCVTAVELVCWGWIVSFWCFGFVVEVC
jgi:hypothetical protein